MRTLTANMATEVATKLGTEPLILVEIEWDSGTGYYADKGITVAPNTYAGSILGMGEILTSGKHDTLGSVGNVTLTLDDSDGALKAILDADLMEGKTATIYQFYDGLVDADKLVLLKGRVTGPIKWDEGQRHISFTVETTIDDQKVGFAPTKSDLPNLSDDAVGVPWPLCFGSALRVPAVQIYKGIYGTIRDKETYSTAGTIYVNDGDKFPQSTPVTIGVMIPKGQNRMFGTRYDTIFYFEGSFSGNVFTTTGRNTPVETNVTFDSRIASDPDASNPSVAWITDSSIDLVNKYCYVTDGASDKMINFCYKQEGAKCYFSKPWKINNVDTNYQLPSGSFTEIEEVATGVRTSWGDTYWNEAVENNIPHRYYKEIPDSWILQPGNRVVYAGLETPTYVANLVESSSVAEVMAYRDIEGEKTLVPVPSSYYTLTLNKSIAGKTATTIEMDIELSLREDEGWDDDLFVSLVSTLGNNSADAIKHIIDTYSGLSSDTTSFTTVSGYMTNYIANFAILDQPNALQVCEDIAWQSRCALLLKSDTVYITYLSREETESDTFTDASIMLKTFSASFTETSDIITKLNGQWREDHERELETYTYEDNISDFGLIEEDRKFWIYNIEQLVKYSAGFWGYRYSNSWRKAFFKAAYDHLKSETFDTTKLSLSQLSGNDLRGFLEDSGVDTAEMQLTYEILLASLAGESDSAGPIEEDNFWKGDPANEVLPGNPMPDDPITGRAQVDYVVEVPIDSRLDTNDRNVERVLVVTMPDSVQRGVNFELTVEMQDSYGAKINNTSVVTLALTSTDGSDVLDTTEVSLSNGEWTGNVQITGGTGEDQGTISPSADDTSVVRPATATIDGTDKPRFITYPDTVVRDQLFDVKIVDGPISGTVSVALTSNDSTGDSLVDSGGSPVASVNTDANGEWTGQWKLTGGTDTSTTAYITLTDAPWSFVGDLIHVLDIETGENPAVFEAVSAATGTWSVGDMVMDNGSWTLYDSDTVDFDDRVGVVYSIEDASNATVLLYGSTSKPASLSGSPNGYYYIDVSAAGAVTQTDGTQYNQLAYQLTDDKITFMWRHLNALAGCIYPCATHDGDARGAYSVDLQTGRSNDDEVAAGAYSGILSGQDNKIAALASNSVICGGSENVLDATYGCIAGGFQNTLGSATHNAAEGFIGGGLLIAIEGDYCFAVGGNTNVIREGAAGANDTPEACGVIGGQYNTIENDHSTVISVPFNCQILGGEYNEIDITGAATPSVIESTILGATNSTITSSNGSISGAAILGGHQNNIECDTASVESDRAIILGGGSNEIKNENTNCVIVGGSSNSIELTDGSLQLGDCGILLGSSHSITGPNLYCVIVGGNNHSIVGDTGANNNDDCGIFAGHTNDIQYASNRSVIIGGYDNTLDGVLDSFILCGYGSTITGSGSAVIGASGRANGYTVAANDAIIIATEYDSGFTVSAGEIAIICDHVNISDGTGAAGFLEIDGTQVLQGQGAAVSDASGGTTVDTEARTAINTLLARVRAHGLIAT